MYPTRAKLFPFDHHTVRNDYLELTGFRAAALVYLFLIKSKYLVKLKQLSVITHIKQFHADAPGEVVYLKD